MTPTDVENEKSQQALLVEDNPEWQAVLLPFLEKRGMAVSVCGCADEALRLLDERPGFDFAFVELDLPDRPGWQLWNRLCTDPGKPKAVFWCQHQERWDRLNLQNNPRVMFLLKPFRREVLHQAIDELRSKQRNFWVI
jgi:DNA-binding response OmpR family regulator